MEKFEVEKLMMTTVLGGTFTEEQLVEEAKKKPLGVMEIYRNGKVVTQWRDAIGLFSGVSKTPAALIPGVADAPESGRFLWNAEIPKIPNSIFRRLGLLYRSVMARMGNAEAQASIIWDTEEKKHFIFVPEQKVTQGSVKYSPHEFDEKFPSPRYIEVVSTHSHNTMGAFFSATDDGDEKATRLYVVFGTLNTNATYKYRATCNGIYIPDLNLNDLIAEPIEDCSAPRILEVLCPRDAILSDEESAWIEEVSKKIVGTATSIAGMAYLSKMPETQYSYGYEWGNYKGRKIHHSGRTYEHEMAGWGEDDWELYAGKHKKSTAKSLKAEFDAVKAIFEKVPLGAIVETRKDEVDAENLIVDLNLMFRSLMKHIEEVEASDATRKEQLESIMMTLFASQAFLYEEHYKFYGNVLEEMFITGQSEEFADNFRERFLLNPKEQKANEAQLELAEE